MNKQELLVWINKAIKKCESEKDKAWTEWHEGNDYGWLSALKEIRKVYYE